MNTESITCFHRKLIKLVEKHPIIYDPTHKAFSCLETKTKAWNRIAAILGVEVVICKNLWIDLRLLYQKFVRNLCQFFQNEQCLKVTRPSMAFESEMLFLWRFVMLGYNRLARRKRPYVVQKKRKLPRPPSINIPTDRYEKIYVKYYKDLVDIIKLYPGIYDPCHPCYSDYAERLGLWETISQKTNFKATKVIKLWFYIYTFYEWKLWERDECQTEDASIHRNEFFQMLSFLDPYIKKNRNTIYNQSIYLTKQWYEPALQFKQIRQFMSVIVNNYPSIVRHCEAFLENPSKLTRAKYTIVLSSIARTAAMTNGQCEVTWLILRAIFLELERLLTTQYVFGEIWYFHSIISKLYQSQNVSLESLLTKDEQHNKEMVTKDNIIEVPVVSINRANAKPSGAMICSKSKKHDANMCYHITTEPKKYFRMYTRKRSSRNNPPPTKRFKTEPPDEDNQENENQITNNGTSSNNSGEETVSVEAPATVLSTEAATIPQPTNHQSNPPPAVDDTNTVRKQFSFTLKDSRSSQDFTIKASTPIPNSDSIKFTTENGDNYFEEFNISIKSVAIFIRDVLNVPYLHLSKISMDLKDKYWTILSKRNSLPKIVCMLLWRYIFSTYDNLNDVVPAEMIKLPLKPPLVSWKVSTVLFEDFNRIAEKYDFAKHANQLPAVIKALRQPMMAGEVKGHVFWKEFELRFAFIDGIHKIWRTLKKAFEMYLDDLERVIYNEWPIEWVPTFSEMKFLVNLRYKKKTPFLYIAIMHINDQIDRYKAHENAYT